MSHTTTSLPVSSSRSVPNMFFAYRPAFLALPTTTRAFDRGADFWDKTVPQETTKDWLKEMIVSSPDQVPPHVRLLITKF